MLGHKWEKVAATVVGVQGGSAVPAPGSGPTFAPQALREYVIEVRSTKGEMLRTTVSETSRFVHPVGSPMHVEVNFKTGEARIDAHGMAQMAQEMLRNRPSAAAGIAPGAANPAGGIAGLLSAIGTASAVTQSVHVIGPGGQEIPVGALGEDISGLVHAMMSGDPAAKQAAMDRIRQLKDQISQRAAADAGYSAPGSTFDPFSAASAEGTVEQRLAKLQQLLDKGILTESEYQAKRQQIINAI